MTMMVVSYMVVGQMITTTREVSIQCPGMVAEKYWSSMLKQRNQLNMPNVGCLELF